MQKRFINIPTRTTFRAIPFTVERGETEETLAPVDLDNVEFFCQFRKNGETGTLMRDTKSGDGITHDNPAQGIASVDEFYLDWPARTQYYMDVIMVDSSFTPPMRDKIMEVLITVGGTATQYSIT